MHMTRGDSQINKKELNAFLSDESLANVPFLVLGNKIDVLDAASENN